MNPGPAEPEADMLPSEPARQALQKIVEYLILKPNAHGTFLNLHIRINLKINTSAANRTIRLKFCILYIFKT